MLNVKELYTHFENEILLYFYQKVSKKKILSQHSTISRPRTSILSLIQNKMIRICKTTSCPWSRWPPYMGKWDNFNKFLHLVLFYQNTPSWLKVMGGDGSCDFTIRHNPNRNSDLLWVLELKRGTGFDESSDSPDNEMRNQSEILNN